MTTISQYYKIHNKSTKLELIGVTINHCPLAYTTIEYSDGLYWIGERRHSMDDRPCEVRGFPANARLVWRDDLAVRNTREYAGRTEGWDEDVIDILDPFGELLGRLRSGSEWGNSCNYTTEFVD